MKDQKNNKKKSELLTSHSNRGESVHQEIKLEDSSNQWEELKQLHENSISTIQLEQEVLKREKEALVEKKKVFLEKQEQKSQREEYEFNRIMEIEQKIKAKKRREIKRRDIAFRNKSILG